MTALYDQCVIRGNDVAPFLRIEPRRDLRRSDEVTEHHCEVAALASLLNRPSLSGAFGRNHRCGLGHLRLLGRHLDRDRRRSGTQRGDGFQELAAIANQRHADVLEIIGRQVGQYLAVNSVFKERRCIAFKSQVTQPGPYINTGFVEAVCRLPVRPDRHVLSHDGIGLQALAARSGATSNKYLRPHLFDATSLAQTADLQLFP